ncbi:grpE protein [Nannizzia gypsea CBS 118893]|uniref:GrpE protein homolog n=1 Tax=Arthroderma gypseum (strain ATCC MYA-4604 / CBS 118893) TaxID=535722 RepID=E4UQM2_ARTGP|nr:grpE protein [Nannizzia gypsea CBS 118893]EFQ99251.1 grpE protein [Nannizzia gypsea CBS 118893]
MFRRALLRQSRLAGSATPSSIVSPIRRQSAIIHQSQQLAARSLPSRVQSRYASTEANGDKPKAEEATEAEKPSELDTLKKDLEAREKEVVDLKDKYLRSVADFRNLQERTRRDVEAARTFAIQKFAGDLIESIDNLERALGAVPPEKVDAANAKENKDVYDLFSGLKMTEGILMNTLKKHGVVRFDPSEPVDGQPQKFDPSRHEALFMSPMEGKQDGDIMHVQNKGFTLNGRVLRAAKVGVVKNA